MANNDPLFGVFPPISRKEWLAKVEKDLKGKSLDDLTWELEEDISISPFFHPDGKEQGKGISLPDDRQQNHWEIGQYIALSNPLTANKETLKCLSAGVNAPLFRLESPINLQLFQQLFEGINPTYISTHFSWSNEEIDPTELVSHFKDYVISKGHSKAQIKGSLAYDPLPKEESLQTLVHLFQNADLQHFKLFEIDGTALYQGTGQTSKELAQLISRGHAYMSILKKAGISPAEVNKRIQFALTVGNSFFVEIAKLRALRLLWLNVLEAYKAPLEMPPIVAHTMAPAADTDPYQHMIQSATQAMSAILGGANRLYVIAADHHLNLEDSRFANNPDFGTRTARNVQHLLQLESFLDRVIDPAAGSYYVESITEQLAEKAWRLFQESN